MRLSLPPSLSTSARLLVVVAAVLGMAPDALAAARVAMLPPHLDADSPVSEGRRLKFHDVLSGGLQALVDSRITVVPAEEVRKTLGDKPELMVCQDDACYGQAAKALGAERVVAAQLSIRSAASGSAYKITLTVYDQNGTLQTTPQGSDSCGDAGDGCTLTKAYDTLKRSASALGGALAAKGLTPSPQAATPAPVGPSPAPATPLIKPLDPPSEKPAAPAPVRETAFSETPKPAGSASYNRWYRYGWIGAASLTGVFVITSIPFLYYASKENEITCGPEVMSSACPQIYKGNLGPGLGLLLGGGLVSAGAFAVLFYLDRREQRRAARANVALLPEPLLGGAGFSLSGRF